MKKIKLTKGMMAMVDDEDYQALSNYKWYAHCDKGFHRNRWYAYGTINGNGPFKMHRLILQAPDGIEVDHINNDGLDNRKGNLRIATHAQNLMSRPKTTRKCTSRFKGVCRLYKRPGWWQAGIKFNYVRINLGAFRTEEDAARAYDAKALELFGEFAWTNFRRAE